MIDTVLQKLIDFLQNASPMIWRVLVKQVYVESFSNFATALVFIVLFVIFIYLGRYLNRKASEERAKEERYTHEDDYQVGSILSYLASGFVVIVSISFAVDAIKMLMNPEYYAITNIIKIISAK